MWQIPIKTPAYKLEGHQGSISQLAYGAQQLISIDMSKTLIIWDLREMAPIQRLEGMKMHQEFPVGRMIYDHKRQGVVSMARRPLLWRIKEKKVPSGHTTPVSAAVYNPMFQTLVSADESSVIRVWNLNTGKAIIRFTDAHVSAKGEVHVMRARMSACFFVMKGVVDDRLTEAGHRRACQNHFDSF